MMYIRTLRADEIECRVSVVKEKSDRVGCSILLYKDARCDMRILDEIYGPMNWTRTHQEIGGRLYCTISVRDPESGEWIGKQDVGTESNAEKEKGQASDSFKRAGFNWGIGRELYTAPFIWINLKDDEYGKNNGRIFVKKSFRVAEIGYNDRREINHLVITDGKNNRFCMHETENQAVDPPKEEKPAVEVAESVVKQTMKLVKRLCDGDCKRAEAWWNEHTKNVNLNDHESFMVFRQNVVDQVKKKEAEEARNA